LKNTQTKPLNGRNSTFTKWKLTQVVENTEVKCLNSESNL